MYLISKSQAIFATLILLSLGGLAGKATAHPHVFIESETEILMNEKHEVTGFRHHWKFDQNYATFALIGMDVDKDGKYSELELAPLAKENIESLHEYGFFTYGSQQGKAFKLKQPENAKLTYENNIMILQFTLPLETPLKVLGSPVKFSVYDPEFFIAFLEPENKGPVKLSANAPKQCMYEKQNAGMDQTALVESRLGQAPDPTNEENKGAGSLFAPSFIVSCLAN